MVQNSFREPLTWAERVAGVIRQSTTRHIGVVPVYYPILEGLGLRATVNEVCSGGRKIDLGRMALILTLNRLMAPQPLYRIGPWVGQTILPDLLGVSVDQLYDKRLARALDALYPCLGELWTRLVIRAIQQEGTDLSVLHWDTTTFYFEGQYSHSELARYGHSSDDKPKCKQAKIGYDVTHVDRLPFLYHLLAGNRTDVTLPVFNLETVVDMLHRPEFGGSTVHPLIVSDGKMVTPPLVAAAHDNDVYYLGPWENTTAVKDTLRSVSREELAAHQLAYRPHRLVNDVDFEPYQGVWRSFSVTHKGRTFADRGLVVWSESNQRLDEEKRKHYLKALLNRLREIQGYLNTGRYIRKDYTAQQIMLAQRRNPAQSLVDVDLSGQDRALALTFAINRQELAEAIALDGKYLLGTNHPHLTAGQALTYFKGQDRIEKRNGVLKGPLQVRPIYLQNDQRIAGLVFINMVALLAWSILERRCQRAGLPHTGQRILNEFAPLHATDQTFADGSRLCQAGDVSDFQQAVLNGLQFPPVDAYLTVPPPMD
jgi:transposase